MSFHFTSGQPSQQLLSDIQSLNAWPVDVLSCFSTVLLAFLSQSSNQEDALQTFTAANPALKSKVRQTLGSLLHFFSSSIKTASTSSANVQSDLVALGLSADRASVLSNEFLASLAAVSEAAISKTLEAAQLHDISWKFGVTASGSELDKMGSTFLQLQMVVERGHGKENVLMELSLPQFYQFLQQMQLANRHMQTISK